MKTSLLVIPLATSMALGWGFTLRHQLAATSTPPADDKTIVSVLNRIGFGPRPGDVDKVRSVGLRDYIDQQLHPEHISDTSTEARLADLSTLRLSSRELADQYERPAIEARRQRQLQQGGTDNPPAADPAGMPDPVQRQAARPLLELGEQKILRATYSDRQLQEVLVDFWFNHFNVDARKGPDRFLLTAYERDTIRPHVLGKFRDLLGATAKSPAMLFYLDNWMSADPNGPHGPARPMPRFGGRRAFGGGFGFPAMPAQPANARQVPKGLNENYGRELMELHTLGVEGGYTQKDVTEVARALTGWTIRNPRLGGEFAFEPRLHDQGQKVVLGHVIKAGGGEEDGEQVLDILARHPATARFIATKLARRFVDDTPPPALVDRLAARFRETDGDLRQVMRTLLASPEFLSPDAYRAKVKTPFEFLVSALRATNADVQNAMPLVRTMQQLGMPLYMCQPPTGYKDTADAWVNTGALVNRMNFSLQLTANKIRGVAVPEARAVRADSDGRAAPNDIVDAFLSGDVSSATRDTIAKATTVEQMAALTLGSPEFQRR
jgi:uncharacterized protein (DUF1800 family)